MAEAVATSPPPAPKKRRWTVAEYLAEADEYPRYELYRGELIEMPSPTVAHQDLVFTICSLLKEWVNPRGLGRVPLAPLDVIFDDENTAQPDVIYVSKENAGIVRDRIWGAPDLVVEILSPSSIRRDRYEKLGLYADFGVKEFWVVDIANRSLEILALRNGRYAVHSTAVIRGSASSLVLSGLEVDVERLFAPAAEA